MEKKKQKTDDEQVFGDVGFRYANPEAAAVLLRMSHRSIYERTVQNFEDHPARNITFAFVALTGLGAATRGVFDHHRRASVATH